MLVLVPYDVSICVQRDLKQFLVPFFADVVYGGGVFVHILTFVFGDDNHSDLFVFGVVKIQPIVFEDVFAYILAQQFARLSLQLRSRALKQESFRRV